ncbi:MAG TPA: PEGA domain-containing protein, partial [Kofleriaceae bacterium]|nr:PEGA domain-containing protein [Kofleriaceae bacterium]
QPALELLALHEASVTAGNAADDLAVPLAAEPSAVAEWAAAEGTVADPSMEPANVEPVAAAPVAAPPVAAPRVDAAPLDAAPVDTPPVDAAPAGVQPDAAPPEAARADAASADAQPDAAPPEAALADAQPAAGSGATATEERPPVRNVLSTAIDAVPKEIDDAHTEAASATPTTRTPALDADEAHPDRVAERRGLPPITVPYVRDRNRRGWLIASGAFSLACLAVAVFVIVWARGEVQRARAEHSVVRPLVASNGPAPAASPSTTTVSMARSAPVPPSAPAQVAPTCAIHVTTNIDGATVYIDGIPHGAAPADVPVACGIDTLVELRHPRYEGFKRSLSVADGTLEVDAHLEREKTELTVWSDPPGATVTYNGHPLGKTPLVTKVNRYERGTLWFRAPGREADWRKIVPKQAAKTVSVKLKPRS